MVGGVSAAIALSGGPKPKPPLAGPARKAATHGAPTRSAVAQSAPTPSAPAQSTPTQTASATPTASTSATAPLSQFRVCTFPADTCNGNLTAMKTEPAQIVTTGDGSGFVKDLAWSGWGTVTAQGTGLLEIDNCTPNCAQGAFTGYPATVTLSGLTPYSGGNQAYADMTVAAPTSPTPQQTFTTGLVP